MSKFDVHSIETAPEKSKPLLQGAKKAFGFVPNLLGVFAESPAALEAYLSVSTAFGKSDLTAAEQQVVLLTVSHDNACTYCVGAHSTIAAMHRVPEQVIEGLREDGPLGDPKLEALRTFTRKVLETRGFVAPADLDVFYAAGYEKRHALEVIAGIAQKILSNYTNHVAGPPLDEAFAKYEWSGSEKATADA